MKHLTSLLLCAGLGVSSLQAATNTLPASAALPLGSSTTRGFIVSPAQGPATPPLANNSLRALRQINGTLTDDMGMLLTNQVVYSEGGDHFTRDTINFEKDSVGFDLLDLNGTAVAYFTTAFFPGIPGSGGHTDNFAVEVVTGLELQPGTYTFGVSVAADRTDVNNDDGYVVSSADHINPRDFFTQQIGAFERNAQAFTANQRNENTFTLIVTKAGIYPVRLLYWQTGLGANLQLYTINPDTTERILVNDPVDARSVKAWRDSNVPEVNSPFIAEISPAPGSEGNKPSDPVSILLREATAVATGSVKLFLNDTQVAPQTLTKTGNKIAIGFNPDPTRSNPANRVRLEYPSGSQVRTQSWTFGIITSGGSATEVTGQWDFNSGDLKATVGTALGYLSATAQTGTKFGTTGTGDFVDIPNINGQPAKIMAVPGALDRTIGYVMTHGISPNGGGTRVNQYTLVMDVFVGTSGPGAAALWQTSSVGNTDDGDLFWQGNNFGQGTDGYKGRGTFTAGAWHRVVAAYDMAATPPVVTKYVDGIKQDDWTANQGLDNPRRSLLPQAVLFGDGDQDERRDMWVNSIQIRSGKLTDAEAYLLGGPSAAGIPLNLPQSNVTGQWDFSFGDLGASIGSNLEYLDGSGGVSATTTQFGTTTDLGIADLPGGPAKIMAVPGALDRNIGYLMTHRIAPNGGGTRVNQYTLVMDVFVGTSGPGAAALLQTSSLANTDDGDLFWQGNNFGQGGGGYNGRGTFTAGAWHRIVAAYDMAATTPVVTKYVDGIKQDDWTANQGLDNPRRSLLAQAVLFGDGDQDERRDMWVSSIQIRSAKLSDAQIVLLGGPSSAGIPAELPTTTVTGQWDFEFGDLGATAGANLLYLDGTNGVSAGGTVFGTTTDLGVANLPDGPAKIMQVPGELDRNIGYLMEHRIAANGGGTRVNQYTLAMDVFVDTGGPGAAALWQTSSVGNTDDGDLFWQGNNFGQGTDGYKGTGAFTAGAWHRVIAAYDMAATPPVVTKYVDGVFQDDWTANQGLDNPRRSLLSQAVLFGDGDQDERRKMWVSSIQIRAGALSKAQMAALGGPKAAGIPLAITGVVEPVKATLGVTLGSGHVTLSWPTDVTGFILESTGGLSPANWQPVSGVVNNSVVVPTSGTIQIFRLKN